jgi:hypothetical protein
LLLEPHCFADGQIPALPGECGVLCRQRPHILEHLSLPNQLP